VRLGRRDREIVRLRRSLTPLPTGEGWLYFACILDLGTRDIVGWSMAERLKTQFVSDALRVAYWCRQPAPGVMAHGGMKLVYVESRQGPIASAPHPFAPISQPATRRRQDEQWASFKLAPTRFVSCALCALAHTIAYTDLIDYVTWPSIVAPCLTECFRELLTWPRRTALCRITFLPPFPGQSTTACSATLS